MASVYGGKHSKAWHTNFPVAGPPHPIHRPLLLLSHLFTRYSPKEKAGLEQAMEFHKMGWGYYTQQSTRPQTLGYGLADSPVGLLAWIYEKLVNWTDAYPWDDDESAYLNIVAWSSSLPVGLVRL